MLFEELTAAHGHTAVRAPPEHLHRPAGAHPGQARTVPHRQSRPRTRPILFTTNFSLTYFTVLGDIDKSKVPVWLLVVDCEGLSVLTAFAAGKLTSESVVHDLEKSGGLDQVEEERPDHSRHGGADVSKAGRADRNEDNGRAAKESSGLPKMLKSLE